MTIQITQLQAIELGAYVALYDDPEEPFTEPVFGFAAYEGGLAPVVRSEGNLVLAGVPDSDPFWQDFQGLYKPDEASDAAASMVFSRQDFENDEEVTDVESDGPGEHDS